MKKKRVVVAMSGGVDSSVSAFLLKEQGYDVIGLFMKNWEEEEGGACTSQQDYEDVARVCQPLSIPFFSVNFSHFYKEKVFSDFLEKLQAGLTPNPDILCNREIKFKILLEQALKLGADLLATGHYAQTNEGKLLRGVDISKDQSYFLYTLKSSILSSVVFPIGHLTKTKVREIALQAGIATATKKDSTGICFIGNKDLRSFLCSYIPYQPGDIQDIVGKKVGTHRGVAYYTLGQRKGLEIGGAGEAWFVIGKDVQKNILIVAQGSSHPALYSSSLLCSELSWIKEDPVSFPYSCTAKIRYRQEDQACTISKEGELFRVEFSSPQRAITPGQSIVFYAGEECLGGGIILP